MGDGGIAIVLQVDRTTTSIVQGPSSTKATLSLSWGAAKGVEGAGRVAGQGGAEGAGRVGGQG